MSDELFQCPDCLRTVRLVRKRCPFCNRVIIESSGGPATGPIGTKISDQIERSCSAAEVPSHEQET
jgi:hypothetical protein